MCSYLKEFDVHESGLDLFNRLYDLAGEFWSYCKQYDLSRTRT